MAAWSRSVNLAAVSLGCLLGRIAELRRCGYCYRRSSAISVMIVSASKSAEMIKIPFVLWIQVRPRNRVEVQISAWERAILRARGVRSFIRSFRAGIQPTLDSRA